MKTTLQLDISLFLSAMIIIVSGITSKVYFYKYFPLNLYLHLLVCTKTVGTNDP